MTVDKDLRGEFAEELRVLIARRKIKQSDMARLLGKSRQYISNICSGKSLFSAEQFAVVFDSLRDKVKANELSSLAEKYMRAKSSFAAEDGEDADLVTLVAKIRILNQENRNAIHKIVDGMIQNQ